MAARPVRRVALLLLLLIGAQAQAGARTDIIDVAVVCAVRRRQVLHHRHTVRADCVAKRCYRWGQKVSFQNSYCTLPPVGIYLLDLGASQSGRSGLQCVAWDGFA